MTTIKLTLSAAEASALVDAAVDRDADAGVAHSQICVALRLADSGYGAYNAQELRAVAKKVRASWPVSNRRPADGRVRITWE